MRHDDDRMTGMQDQLMVTCAVLLAVLVKTKKQEARKPRNPRKDATKPTSREARKP